MIQPGYRAFRRLARQGNLVPVYDTFTADLLTPVGAYLRLAREARYAFLLESVEGGEKIARYTFVGADPVEVFRYTRGASIIEGQGRLHWQQTNPVEFLRHRIARYRPVRLPGLPPLVAGAIGYFAYDVVRLIERIPARGRDDMGLDDAVLMFYLGLVAFDHVQHRVWVVRSVFTEGQEETLRFQPTPPPTDEEVGVVLATICARVRRLLRRRGLDADSDVTPPDPVAEESPALAGINSASIQGRVALGRRAGAAWRVGEEPDAPWMLSSAPHHAHLDGFDLHANVAVPAADRARLEQLCRYVLRPAVSQDRLQLLDDGRVLLSRRLADLNRKHRVEIGRPAVVCEVFSGSTT